MGIRAFQSFQSFWRLLVEMSVAWHVGPRFLKNANYFILLCVSLFFLMYACEPFACLVPPEAKRGHQSIPPNSRTWSYRYLELQATKWILGTEARSSTGTDGALNHWAIFLNLHRWFCSFLANSLDHVLLLSEVKSLRRQMPDPVPSLFSPKRVNKRKK